MFLLILYKQLFELFEVEKGKQYKKQEKNVLCSDVLNRGGLNKDYTIDTAT